MMRFENVTCSQCGGDFGPGDSGFSHCEDHWLPLRLLKRIQEFVTTDHTHTAHSILDTQRRLANQDIAELYAFIREQRDDAEIRAESIDSFGTSLYHLDRRVSQIEWSLQHNKPGDKP